MNELCLARPLRDLKWDVGVVVTGAAAGRLSFTLPGTLAVVPGVVALMFPAGLSRSTSASGTSTGSATPQHLHPVTDHTQFASLLAVGFPGIEFQPAFDQNRRSLCPSTR